VELLERLFYVLSNQDRPGKEHGDQALRSHITVTLSVCFPRIWITVLIITIIIAVILLVPFPSCSQLVCCYSSRLHRQSMTT